MESDGLRLEVDLAIDLAETVQRLALEYETAINNLRQQVLLLSLNSSNSYANSSARLVSLIGEDLTGDKEITGQVKSNLQDWRRLI